MCHSFSSLIILFNNLFCNYFFLLEKNRDAANHIEKRRPVPPKKYNYKQKRNTCKQRKSAEPYCLLERKINVIDQAQRALSYLNNRVKENSGIEIIDDLTLSDVDAYESALSSESDECSDSEEEDNIGDETESTDLQINKFQTDITYSGNYRFIVDVISQMFILILTILNVM